jgi:hypothetical protein
VERCAARADIERPKPHTMTQARTPQFFRNGPSLQNAGAQVSAVFGAPRRRKFERFVRHSERVGTLSPRG